MKTKLLTLALLALSASAQTFTCVGCTDYGPIGTTGYTMQYGARMVWTANVEPGAYLVRLLFVEPIYTTKGQRPLNAWVNGFPVFAAYDILGDVAPMAPVTWHTPTTDANGKLVVILTANDTGTLIKTKHSAIISAISATKLTGGGGPAPPPVVIPSTACQLTRTSPTLLTMNECPILVSGVFFNIAPGTIGVSAGTGRVWVGIDVSTSTPAGRVVASSQLVATCAGLGGCQAPQAGEQFVTGDLPVGMWSVTNGQFDLNGYTPTLATIQGYRLQSLGGLVQEQSGHTVKIRINTDVYPPVQ